METVPKGREQGKGPGRELLSSGMASGRGSGGEETTIKINQIFTLWLSLALLMR